MKMLIYGSGHLGIQAYHLVKSYLSEQWTVLGFIDDSKKKGEVVIGQLTVLGGKEVLAQAEYKACAMVMAIGPNALEARLKIYRELKAMGYQFPNLIHPSANVDATVNLGEGNMILAGATLDHSVSIGDINYIDINSAISHNSEFKDNNFFTVGCVTAGFVKLGSSCFVGIQSTISDKVEIGDNSYIFAKSLVSQSLPAQSKLMTVYQRKMLE